MSIAANTGFARLADVLLRSAGVVGMIYEAFLDESGCDDYSKVLVVGGYLIESGQARIMERKWQAILQQYNLPFFHMVDCAHDPGNGVFSGMPKAKRINVATKLIELINRHTAWGFAFCCPPKRHVNKDGLRDPYTMALEGCLFAISAILNTELLGDSFSMFIEAGHASASLALQRIEEAKAGGIASKLSSYEFVTKERSPLVQAADILSWQVARNIKGRVFETEVRKNRGDFNALVRSKTSIFYMWLAEDRAVMVMDVSPHVQQPKVIQDVTDLFSGKAISSPPVRSFTDLVLTGVRPQGVVWSGSDTLRAIHRR